MVWQSRAEEKKTFELEHDKTNKNDVHPAKIQSDQRPRYLPEEGLRS